MKMNNQDKDDEFIEKNFKPSVEELKWHLIKEQLVKNAGVKIEEADLLEAAKDATRAQFAQYGMPNAPEEMLENFAKNILDNKEQSQKIYEKLYEQKVVESVRSKVKVTEKAVSAEDFAELAKNI